VDTTLPVMLNTVEAYATFPDNRGNLVAKFKMAAMESLLAAPTTSLTLTGYTWSGTGFSGTDSVRVIE
jgi:hypothetical protein